MSNCGRAIVTYLRKKHRGKWYEQNIVYCYYGNDMADIAMKEFVKTVYNYMILGKVDLKLKYPNHLPTPFRLSEDQRSEEERLIKLLTHDQNRTHSPTT